MHIRYVHWSINGNITNNFFSTNLIILHTWVAGLVPKSIMARRAIFETALWPPKMSSRANKAHLSKMLSKNSIQFEERFCKSISYSMSMVVSHSGSWASSSTLSSHAPSMSSLSFLFTIITVSIYWSIYLRDALPYQIVCFFEHCSNGLWPPLPPSFLNIYVADYIADYGAK